jgi:hypothetical protein
MGIHRLIGTVVTALCVAVIAAMFCASALALPAEQHPYISSLSMVGKVQAGATCGVATDSHGDIYVPNFFEEKIKVYSATATLLAEFKTPAKTNGPCGVAVDSSGDVYVECFGTEIVKYKPKGGEFPPTSSTKFEIEKSFAHEGVLSFSSEASQPKSITLDPVNQDLYVAAKGHIDSYTAAGAPISETIGEGLVPDVEYLGVGVYGVNEDVYVSAYSPNAGKHMAYIFNPTGTMVLTEITGAGAPAGRFGFAPSERLAVDQSDGDVYVGDIGDHDVVDEFEPSGAYVAEIGPEFGPSLELEQDGPSGIAVDDGALSPNKGDVYVTGNHAGKSNLYAFGPLIAIAEDSMGAQAAGTGKGAVECKVPKGDYTTCLPKYAAGTELTVRAKVAEGSELAEVAGTGSAQSCTASPCTFTLAEASTVTATIDLISLAKFPLTVAVTPSGSGTVQCKVKGGSLEPCAAEYEENAEVEVIETPGSGYGFEEWSEACSGSGTCMIKMTGAESVTAKNRVVSKFQLHVSNTDVAAGTVTSSPAGIDCGEDLCAAEFSEGQEVTLTATPEPGQRFVEWSGEACAGATATTCKVTISKETTVSAKWEATHAFPLTVFITGQGKVESTPAGVSCSSPAEECTAALEGEVTLTETPKAGSGYEFAGWIGCRKASVTTCKVDVTAAGEVTAVFLKAGTEGKEGPQGSKGETGANGANGKEGAQGQKGEPGSKGSAGPEGPKGVTGETGAAGATGPAGEKGASGPQGERGAPGAQGPAGPAGQVELVTCKKAGKRLKCTTKLVSGTVKFTATGGGGAAARATLSRHGAVYAAGAARSAHGRLSLRLQPLRKLRPGRYTLTLIGGSGRHERIESEAFTLSAGGRLR